MLPRLRRKQQFDHKNSPRIELERSIDGLVSPALALLASVEFGALREDLAKELRSHLQRILQGEARVSNSKDSRRLWHPFDRESDYLGVVSAQQSFERYADAWNGVLNALECLHMKKNLRLLEKKAIANVVPHLLTGTSGTSAELAAGSGSAVFPQRKARETERPALRRLQQCFAAAHYEEA